MQNSNVDSLLALTCLGIGHPNAYVPNSIDWLTIKDLASQQGLSAIVLDGIGVLRERGERELPSKELTLRWIGEVLQGYEQRYSAYKNTIAELASFYNSVSLRMMVLKGYSCSLDWPKPEHRPCGDIDIWMFGYQGAADALLSREKKIEIDKSHHHHTVFYMNDFMVENHYDFINVHHHKSSSEVEKILKELGKDDTCFTIINGEKVYTPSPNLHALFLLRHSSSHFASEGITLRQILDWGFFVEKHGKDVDWEWLTKTLDCFGMIEFYNITNAICVENLGFNSTCFPYSRLNPVLKERVLSEILFPEFGVAYPNELINRLVFKIRRWKGSVWKHRLCYSDSLWSAFWNGIWNHILKPSSI